MTSHVRLHCHHLFTLSDLDASHKREKIETDLIGAYYLEVGEAPRAQFGQTELSACARSSRALVMLTYCTPTGT